MLNRLQHAVPAASRRGFTLIELGVTLAATTSLLAIAQPVMNQGRGQSRAANSKQNLRAIGAGSASFAMGNQGEIFALGLSNALAQQQAVNIIARLSGRPMNTADEQALQPLSSITPKRRYQHLVLADWMSDSLPDPVFASPFDRNLRSWQADPVFAQDNTVPYVDGQGRPGADRSDNWTNDDVQQLWAYGSSYQVVPAAWNVNTGPFNSWGPVASTPHLFFIGRDVQRFTQEVAFPSQKVHLFEEFDWQGPAGQALWFAYPEAKCNLLFFDGSVRRRASSGANPGANPREPNQIWRQRYVPLDTFPWYALGYRNRDEFTQKFRWTREGLGGIDFGGDEVGRPEGFDDDFVDPERGNSIGKSLQRERRAGSGSFPGRGQRD